MSRREPVGRSEPRHGRFRAYLRRFFTSWVADDPEPTYSSLDRSDGLGQVPDPVTTPKRQLPESAEVSEHVPGADRTRGAAAGRSHR